MTSEDGKSEYGNRARARRGSGALEAPPPYVGVTVAFAKVPRRPPFAYGNLHRNAISSKHTAPFYSQSRSQGSTTWKTKL